MLKKIHAKQGSSKVIPCGSSSSTEEQPDTNLVAKNTAMIDELQKKVYVLQTRSANLQKLLQVIDKNGNTIKPQVLLKNLKKTEISLKKLLSTTKSFESKLKELTKSISNTTAIQESGPTKCVGRAVSNTTTNLPSGTQEHLITVGPAPAPSSPKVVRFNLPTENVRAESPYSENEIGLPLRPSSALRRFLLAPSASTSSKSERRMNELRRIKRETHKSMFGERPRTAHHSRIRSVTRNIQEYLPYNCDHEDEVPVPRSHPGNEGMRRFELAQNAMSQTTSHCENNELNDCTVYI